MPSSTSAQRAPGSDSNGSHTRRGVQSPLLDSYQLTLGMEMLAHHLCTAQGHRLLCWHDRGCNTPHVPCQRHDSSIPPQLFQQSPKPMAEPASCSRAAQPCHDHFEDMSQDTPNSAPSPKHHCVSSPSLWAPLAPAYFWSLFSNEVPKGDSGLGAGSAQLPA